MSIREEPEKAVPILRSLLDSARKNIVQESTSTADDASLASQFKHIEDKLVLMAEPLQSFKMCFIDELCELEKDVAHLRDSETLEIFKRKIDWMSYHLLKFKNKLSTDLLSPFSTPNEEENTPSNHHQIDSKIHNREEMSSKFSSLESNQVKICLLHLSIFPENAVIKKRPIIYWWMGEGLVTAEEIGEKVFKQTLELGFIKPEIGNQWPTVNSFTVPPWIRLMLIEEANKCQFLDFSPDGKVRNEESSNALFLQGADELRNISAEMEASLWSVYNVSDRIVRIKPNWGFWRLKKVNVLQLGRWQSNPEHHIEVENQDILNGSSEYLKYLSLRGISRIEALPKSILRLPRLEILDLRACHNLEMLPDGIWELNRLTHLDLSECYLLDRMPKGIENLGSLQVLKGFVMGKGNENSCKLVDLRRLVNLRKLSIRVVGDHYSELDLSSFRCLQILTIGWSVGSAPPAMSLPPSLEKLELRGWPLKELKIQNFPRTLEKLYILGGELNSLFGSYTIKFLRLKYLPGLSIHGKHLELMFPNYVFILKIGCARPCPDETFEKSFNKI